jgi:hypothetical protein
LITEDVVSGKVPPLYFGRDGKERFHETIMQEEDDYLSRMRSANPAVEKTHSKPNKGEQREREAYGGIP